MNLEKMKKSYESLKKMVDGEPKNINPLKEIPEPQMRLYGHGACYFQTKEELESYCKNNKISIDNSFVADYLGNVAGRSDVIRKTWTDGTSVLYTAVDRYGYGMYNHKRSVYRGEFTWEYNYGSIKEMYLPFKERGITFEDDVYGKIAESDKQLMKKVREARLFNCI